jgi:DNA modification methylase
MQDYKTISFPTDESGTDKVERLRLKLPNNIDRPFASWLLALHSSDARHILGKSYTELAKYARDQKRTLSNMALYILEQKFNEGKIKDIYKARQLNLFNDISEELPFGVKGTFFPNHNEAIHRWYPYIEGFSSSFVEMLLNKYSEPNFSVYDPFAGVGTTVAVSAFMNMQSYYAEINPFLRLVIECKTNYLREIMSSRKTNLVKHLENIYSVAEASLPSLESALECQKAAFGNKAYYSGRRLIEIVALKKAIDSHKSSKASFQALAKLILGSIAVSSSEMIRAADLRYRTETEKLREDYSVLESYLGKMKQVISDIDAYNSDNISPVILLTKSSLEPSPKAEILDLIITSPPYLNGTNYFRNTKLELWLCGFIEKESELADYRQQALAAGINNIAQNNRAPQRIPAAEEVASKLDAVAYDRRIPELVRRYFSDSYLWIKNSFRLLKDGGRAIIDIGDSQFAGIHVPTDEILISIAEECGFKLEEARFVRKRRSKSGAPLKQVIIILKKTTGTNKISLSTIAAKNTYIQKAKDFSDKLPYLMEPYCKRNWGHGLHSLCSYQGKLKPAIAYFLVNLFSSPGEKILDPMSGSGTIPLEAFLQERVSLGNDLQELGFFLTLAKIQKGTREEAMQVYEALVQYVEKNQSIQDTAKYSSFGYNGKIPEYFHKKTLKEILAARNFIKDNPCMSWGQAIVYSCLLHILHGNRPYALSRKSHPVTPFKPSGDFIYKSLKEKLKEKVERTLNIPMPENTLPGGATNLPYDQLSYDNEVDVVITSPPFSASTRFFMSNWMRLWFAGWEPEDFSMKPESFLEVKQKLSMDAYKEFFNCCYNWLRPGGRLIMHVGKSSTCNMADELAVRASTIFELMYAFDEDVTLGEKFGIRDQGATTSHQYLFFQARK